MKTFLDTVAFDLFRRTSGHMENVTIIFPNKRASLFMDQSLSHLTDRLKATVFQSWLYTIGRLSSLTL